MCIPFSLKPTAKWKSWTWHSVSLIVFSFGLVIPVFISHLQGSKNASKYSEDLKHFLYSITFKSHASSNALVFLLSCE